MVKPINTNSTSKKLVSSDDADLIIPLVPKFGVDSEAERRQIAKLLLSTPPLFFHLLTLAFGGDKSSCLKAMEWVDTEIVQNDSLSEIDRENYLCALYLFITNDSVGIGILSEPDE